MVSTPGCADHCLHLGVAGLPAGAAQCCWCNQQFGLSGTAALGSGSHNYRTNRHTGQYGAGSSAGPNWATIKSNGGKD